MSDQVYYLADRVSSRWPKGPRAHEWVTALQACPDFAGARVVLNSLTKLDRAPTIAEFQAAYARAHRCPLCEGTGRHEYQNCACPIGRRYQAIEDAAAETPQPSTPGVVHVLEPTRIAEGRRQLARIRAEVLGIRVLEGGAA